MATARVPLANNPNAANSPFQGLGPISGKRSRAQTETTKELVHGLPPAKRQLVAVQADGENAPPTRTLLKQAPVTREIESKLLMRKPANAPVTELNRRLLVVAREQKAAAAAAAAAQDKSARTTTAATSKTDESLAEIRQWQKHYKKHFPQFVFYFDNVTEEARAKYSRLVQSLSAKEEKFFSRSVTHVITTRPIPDGKTSAASEPRRDAARVEQTQKTINPALLNKVPTAASNNALRRTTDLLDASLQSRAPAISIQGSQTIDLRRNAGQTMDILVKARELGIKIWALEKLQRMMNVMFNSETGEQQLQQALSRSQATQNLTGRANKEIELQRMLRYEKIAGPADRDMAVATQDMVQLRGYYLYVHDMDERTRPTMVRDYPKTTKEDGKWPQFRLTALGRCPFIEDPNYIKRVTAEEKEIVEASRLQATRGTGPPTHARATAEHAVLTERQANLRRSPRKHPVDDLAKPLDPPKVPVSRHNSTDMPPLFGSAQANMRVKPRYIGGEPVASGVGPSNITSAIRSRVISSTAISSTAPDVRAGTSKELHALKRKVLERGTTATSAQTLTSSYMNDVRAALNGGDAAPQRPRKRTAADALGNIYEETDGEEQRPKKVIVTRRTKTVVHKDPKPGYCENCRDKFDDFDEHVLSRKHRKFALDQQNWAQLDKLLGLLVRQ